MPDRVPRCRCSTSRQLAGQDPGVLADEQQRQPLGNRQANAVFHPLRHPLELVIDGPDQAHEPQARRREESRATRRRPSSCSALPDPAMSGASPASRRLLGVLLASLPVDLIEHDEDHDHGNGAERRECLEHVAGASLPRDIVAIATISARAGRRQRSPLHTASRRGRSVEWQNDGVKRSGVADLPLHGGRVPAWLATRMETLGTAIAESVLAHYGRPALLSRLSDPFWFQALGTVMGMDWHSSGITTSVIGALKRGLNPRAHELGVYICGGRGRHSRNTPRELLRRRGPHRRRRRRAGAHEPPHRPHRQQRRRRRLPDLSPRLRGDARRRLGGGAARHERRQRAGPALPLAFGHGARFRGRSAHGDRGRARRHHPQPRGRPRRAGAAGAADDCADRSGPDPGRGPAPRDARTPRCAARRRARAAARRRAGARPRARPARFRVVPAARTARAAHAAVAGAGRRSRAWRAGAVRRSGPLLVRPRRQGRSSFPGAAHRCTTNRLRCCGGRSMPPGSGRAIVSTGSPGSTRSRAPSNIAGVRRPTWRPRSPTSAPSRGRLAAAPCSTTPGKGGRRRARGSCRCSSRGGPPA